MYDGYIVKHCIIYKMYSELKRIMLFFISTGLIFVINIVIRKTNIVNEYTTHVGQRIELRNLNLFTIKWKYVIGR